MSLCEFLTKICKPEFNLDEIKFDLTWFELAENNPKRKQKEFLYFGMHLGSTKTNGAIAVLASRNESIGHAVSMYKFCQDTQTFYYKDSSVTAYESVNLRTNSSNCSEELKILPTQRHRIVKAWTFRATRKMEVD